MSVTQPVDRTELRDALGVLVAQPGLSRAERNHQIDLLLAYTEKRGLSLEHCLVAKAEGRSVAACLCVDCAGRTSSVFVPNLIGTEVVADAVVTLLDEAAARAGRRDVEFLQGLLRPEAEEEAKAHQQAGFELLAQLIYLESDLTQRVLPGRPAPPLSWETYRPETHELLASVVEATYEGTLDCGSLNGLRDIEDILASHRATGEFDPRFWLVGLVNGEPVGTILLSYVPERPSYEVVYMGVLPRWRGQGYGGALLRRGIEIARHHAVTAMALAVDSRNTLAWELYRRFGFREVCRRDAWIRVLSGSSSASERGPNVGS